MVNACQVVETLITWTKILKNVSNAINFASHALDLWLGNAHNVLQIIIYKKLHVKLTVKMDIIKKKILAYNVSKFLSAKIVKIILIN